jgi:hypothetical protein
MICCYEYRHQQQISFPRQLVLQRASSPSTPFGTWFALSGDQSNGNGAPSKILDPIGKVPGMNPNPVGPDSMVF